jgi:predicted alpha-1,2-mannosidase
MKKLTFIALAMGAALASCSTATVDDYASFVDPMIGTGANGHTFPGAVVPNGMIQPSPDTRIDGWDACSGYHYSDSLINGFSHTHLSGTGCADYGDVLIMPTVGTQKIDPQDNSAQNLPFASAFTHDKEVAEPGYYSVHLDTYDVQAEITATKRGAIHRFTFPETDSAGMIVDMDYSIQHQRNLEMEVEAVSATELRGWKRSSYWADDQRIFFYAEFSTPFTCKVVKDTIANPDGSPYARCKALLSFPELGKDNQVLVKVGVSAVDYDGAKQNVTSEIADFDFDKVRSDARQAWNNYLSKIEAPLNADATDLKKFYTALYHTAISPNLFTDADGRHLGMDKEIKQGSVDQPIYTVFSLWDTFRALHPLISIIDPQLNNDYINSLLVKADEGGVLPMWELAANYTGCMIGYHSVSLMADAVTKGIADFDVNRALKAAVHTAEYHPEGIKARDIFIAELMPPAKEFKNRLGYIPSDGDNESVAKALEFAYDDWCIAQLAKAAGDTAVERRYTEFAKAYTRYFDHETGFMRGVMSDGSWREPFNPNASNHRNDDYCEGTAWQWTWFVPHDVQGLIDLMGGEQKFIDKLDGLFSASSELAGDLVSADISGLIGQYAQGNEPSHHIIHFYNYVHQPWKTQQLIDQVFEEQYFASPEGLSGNEDCGQMSAWLVMNAMGFYQVAPGNPTYSIGRPLFEKIVINLPNGKKFTVSVGNFAKTNRYIASATLNGKQLDTPFFTHADLVNGGELHLEMTDKPTDWGTR